MERQGDDQQEMFLRMFRKGQQCAKFERQEEVRFNYMVTSYIQALPIWFLYLN